MYNKVIDPITKKSFKITSKIGKQILKKYTKVGGSKNILKKKKT